MSCIPCLNSLDVQKGQTYVWEFKLWLYYWTLFSIFISLLTYLWSSNSSFLCCRDNPKLPYMVSKNSDKIHNSSWGPQEKRLVLKHSLNIKETHIRLLITSKRISFRQHSSMSLSDIIQKTSTTGRLAGKPNPLFMTVTCCITITAVLKLGRYSSEIPPFGCAYKKKKKKLLRETHLLTSSGILENFYHAVPGT